MSHIRRLDFPGRVLRLNSLVRGLSSASLVFFGNKNNPISSAKKIALEVEKAVYKYVPLKLIKPTSKEAKTIESAVKRTDKSGKWTSAEALIKKHG